VKKNGESILCTKGTWREGVEEGKREGKGVEYLQRSEFRNKYLTENILPGIRRKQFRCTVPGKTQN
jgi:hypothetical protein